MTINLLNRIFPDTTTAKLQLAVLPDASKNRYVTGVVPIGKDEPGACVLLLDGGTPELSLALGSFQLIKAKLLPAGAVPVTVLGQPVITGGVLSTGIPVCTIFIVNEANVVCYV